MIIDNTLFSVIIQIAIIYQSLIYNKYPCVFENWWRLNKTLSPKNPLQHWLLWHIYGCFSLNAHTFASLRRWEYNPAFRTIRAQYRSVKK